jgi:hypothetical protein
MATGTTAQASSKAAELSTLVHEATAAAKAAAAAVTPRHLPPHHHATFLGIHLTGEINTGELLVALGTVLLAGVTWRLSRRTAASVDVARQTAEAERASVDAMHMPFVIAVPTPITDLAALHEAEFREVPLVDIPSVIHRKAKSTSYWVLGLRLWNLGVGPAIVKGLRLTDGDGTEYLDDTSPDQPCAAGQSYDPEIEISQWPDNSRAATLTIDYVDASGKPYVTESKAWINGDAVTCTTHRRLEPS